MARLTKSEQARLNGSKSRGPITAEGKKRSSLNAMRHGILAKQACLTMESQAEYQSAVQDFLTRFQPADGVELRLVEQMANCAWRLERCHAMETALLDNEMDAIQTQIGGEYEKIGYPSTVALSFKSLADQSKALALYLRYEASIIRQYDRAFKLLMELRAKVPPPETQPEPETAKRTHESPEPEDSATQTGSDADNIQNANPEDNPSCDASDPHGLVPPPRSPD